MTSKHNEQKSDQLLKNFNNDLGLLSSSDYSTTPEEIIDKIENDIKGSDVQVKNQIEEIFFNNVHDYISETFNGIIYNDVANTNYFITKNLLKEIQRLSKKEDNIKNNTQRLRQQYKELLSNISKTFYTTNLIKFSIFALLSVFLLIQLSKDKYVSQVSSFSLITIIVLIYLIVIVYNILKNKNRKKGNWDEYVFKVKPPKN